MKCLTLQLFTFWCRILTNLVNASPLSFPFKFDSRSTWFFASSFFFEVHKSIFFPIRVINKNSSLAFCDIFRACVGDWLICATDITVYSHSRGKALLSFDCSVFLFSHWLSEFILCLWNFLSYFINRRPIIPQFFRVFWIAFSRLKDV